MVSPDLSRSIRKRSSTRTNFITAKAAARQMIKAERGVILTLSTPGSRVAGTGFLGYGITRAAVEALTRMANVAAFLASDQAGGMTGAIANLSCGALGD